MTPIEKLRAGFDLLCDAADDAFDGGMPSQSDMESVLLHLDRVDNALRAVEESHRLKICENAIKILHAIEEYSPDEVCYDEFAYKRYQEGVRGAVYEALYWLEGEGITQ